MDPLSRTDPIREFYEQHPEMVSSPFGGVTYYRFDLLESIWERLEFDVAAGAHILEVGCGRAFLRPWVARKGAHYTGVDLVCSKGIEGEPGPAALASAEVLPFADGQFHRLICIDSFEHFPHPAMAVEEFQRVLRPGGEVFLSSPNYGNVAGWVKWWMETWGGWEKDTWAPFGGWTPQAHEHALTLAKVRSLFRSAGFSDGRAMGFAEEIHLGLCPWAARPGFPEAILFRLQRCGQPLKHWTARNLPTLSLHQFWRWRKPRRG